MPDNEISAERAVDGQKSNLTVFGGECTASAYEKPTAEWRVDLGTVLSIHHILIQYATNDEVWGEICSGEKYCFCPSSSTFILVRNLKPLNAYHET